MKVSLRINSQHGSSKVSAKFRLNENYVKNIKKISGTTHVKNQFNNLSVTFNNKIKCITENSNSIVHMHNFQK